MLLVSAEAIPPLSIKSFETTDLYTHMVRYGELTENGNETPPINETVLQYLSKD